MRNRIYPFVVLFCILAVASHPLGAQQESNEGKENNGLRTVKFETKNGEVEVTLPSTIHAGDVISGTVISQPKGKNERQKTKNRNVLNGYVIEIEEKDSPTQKKKAQPVKNQKGSWILPETIAETGVRFLLKDSRQKVVGEVPVPASPMPRDLSVPAVLTENDFAVPSYLRAGEPERITGHFDGDFTTSALEIGNTEAEVLAESPGELFFETPEEISGPVDVELREDDFTMEEEVNVLDLDISAGKLNLVKGEQTQVHVSVNGLEGLETEVPLELANLTPSSIEMEGGNQQGIIIAPEDISADGTYSLDLGVTAASRGGFSVMATIVQMQQALPGDSKLLTKKDEKPVEPAEGGTPTIPTKGERKGTPDEKDPPPEEEEDCCIISRSASHSSPHSEFKISENYLDEEKRQVLDSIYEDVPAVNATNMNSFIRSKLPASAYGIGYFDVVSGYCNAISKHILLEADGGSDWVWTTEKLDVEGKTKGEHTLSVATDEECSSFVVGAAGGVVQVWTGGIDPVANHRDLLAAFKWTRDVAILVALGFLAIPTGGASVAVGLATLGASKWFDSEFTTDSNAGVKAEGKILFTAKGRSLMLQSNSGTTISDDGEITSDNVKVSHGTRTWTDPSSLTINTEGFCTMKCFSEDNGVVDGTIESQAGIVIIGFCFYEDGGWRWEYLSCSSLGINDENPQNAITRTEKDFQTGVESLMKEEFPGTLSAAQARNKAQTELPGKLEDFIGNWYRMNAYDKEKKTGYFRLSEE